MLLPKKALKVLKGMEEFPSLPKKFFWKEYPFPQTRDEILKHCLDKQKVKKSFGKLELSEIESVDTRSLYYYSEESIEKLKKELGL